MGPQLTEMEERYVKILSDKYAHSYAEVMEAERYFEGKDHDSEETGTYQQFRDVLLDLHYKFPECWISYETPVLNNSKCRKFLEEFCENFFNKIGEQEIQTSYSMVDRNGDILLAGEVFYDSVDNSYTLYVYVSQVTHMYDYTLILPTRS